MAGGALAHVGVPVYHGGALAGQPGADHHVHLYHHIFIVIIITIKEIV